MAIGISRILRYCEGVEIHALMTRCGEWRRWPMGVHVDMVRRGGRRAHAPELTTQWRVKDERDE